MKKILLIGLGSIGQRHLRNLHFLNKKFKFLAYRRKKTVPTLDDNLKPIKNVDLKSLYNLKVSNSLKYLIDQKPYAAFICSPTSFHIEEAIICIKNNINVFIEKPLGSSARKLSELKKVLTHKKKDKIQTMMGFQTKFNPLYNYLRKYLAKNKNKKIRRVEIFNGESIKDFHKYEDYRVSYAARKKLGGGVLLSQIHEIDYFLDLFKNYRIKILSSKLFKKSNLKIDVEDTFDANLEIENRLGKSHANIHLDFYTKPKKKFIKIFFEDKHNIVCDFSKKKFVIKKRKKYIKKFNFKNNDPFKQEVKFFLNSIKKNNFIKDRFNIYNGIKTLEFCLKLKRLNKYSF